jgi:CHAD domain-containing protein
MAAGRRSSIFINIMSASRRRYDLLRKRLDQFTRMLHGLGEGDPSALHRTRVASRRLREILPVLQLKPGLADRLGRRLKKVTAQLGAVRELDVLADLMEELKVAGRCDREALRHVALAIGDGRGQARDRLYAKLPIRELERIARKLDKAGGDLRDRKPSRGWQWAVDARVSRRVGTLTDALDAAGSLYLPERLHHVRIALKKFRYALEVAGEAAGTKQSPDLRALKRHQDALGRLHDVQVLVDRVREMQPWIAAPDFSMWQKTDALIAWLEDDCRRQHAKFLRQRRSLRAICERVSRAADAAPQARRAMVG